MDPVPEEQRQRDLSAIVADGVAYSAMIGLGESYLPAFILAAGLGEVAAGLLATVPMLAGAFLQLVSPYAARRLGSYRSAVVLCARLQALSFLPIALCAAFGQVSIFWVAVSAVAYWGFGMAAGPPWNAWITTLVPTPMRARFFARRTRWCHVAVLTGLMVGGFALEARDDSLVVFALLFAGAMAARWISSRCLARQSEAPGLAVAHHLLGPAATLAAVREARTLRLLAYLVAMQAAAHVAAPYFTPYMLGPLGLSYSGFMVLTAASFLARIAVMPLLGRIAHRRGARLLLWCGALGIVPLPMLWLVSDSFWYLLGVQAVAGVAWGAVELATLLSFFEGIEEKVRASVLAAYNLANAVAVALGALVGAEIFGRLDGDGLGYVGLFVASSATRLLTLALLRRARAAEHPAETLSLRTLAVRPSGVAVQRPILASLGDEEGGPPEPAAPSAQDPSARAR